MSDQNWFRPPTRREHWIAAGLFAGFGIFFILLFVFLLGWWFRWVMLILGIWSLWKACEHLLGAKQQNHGR